jgi:hypothetical protein
VSSNENIKTGGAPMTDKNPFPGLSSFSEADAEKFFGRADETAELLRMVKREVLTVVFGRSGLGKTSLLQAGLVPLLRQSGFLPVCIRLNFVDQSQDVAAQVKTAVQRECAAQRVDLQFSELRDDTAIIQAGSGDEPAFRDPESSGARAMTLWEFFHRALFWNQRNELLTPVLLFDQFEEIFTVGNDHAAVPRFIEEIADLIENRIPASERSRGAESLGFAYDKRNFKVIVSLREDFLPSLEELTKDIPSLSTNRMRLVCLNGEQALTAVRNPAAGVFDEKVSRSIVKLVAAAQASSASSAKAAELKDMSVEPALLGVVCRELYARYLEDSELVVAEEELGKLTRDILQGFYKRCVNGLPVATRVFIEERLLTRNGYRGTVALEDALSSGEISNECINQLVDRRLLRVADRFGTKYLELTHDVLTKVILASRDRRRASEQAEILRRERDQARRKVRRLAVLTSVMAGLTLLTVALGVFATAKSEQAKAKSDEAAKAMKHAERAYDNSLHQLNRLIRLTGRRNLIGTNDIQLATEFFDATDKLSPGGKLRLSGYTNLADILAVEGNTDKALEWYNRGIRLASDRRAVRDEVDWNHALWICYQREGDIHLANGDARSALAAYEAALHISAAEETNAPAPSRPHWLSRRADTLSSIALAQFQQAANSAAGLSLSNALALAKQAANRLSDDIEMRRKLAAELDQLADLLIETGNSKGAQEVAIEAFMVRTNFIAGLSNGAPAADRSSLAGIYERLAEVALGSGSNSVALSNLNLATSIRTNLLREELLNFDWWRLGARIFEKRALAFIEGNNSTAAFDAYDRALQWRERFWKQDTNNAVAARDYAKTLIVYTDLLRMAGKKTNSAAAALQALDLIDHLKEFYVRPNSTNLIWLQELADAYESVAVSQGLMNETNAAHAEFTKAIQCREELCRRDEKNDRFKFKRATTLGRAAEFYITGGSAMTNAAFACANAERQLLDDLYSRHPEYLPYGQTLGNAYKRLGTLYGKMAENVPAHKESFGRLALTNHLSALAVRERIYTSAPNYEKWWHGLALCYGRAGETYLEVCDFGEREECLNRAATHLLTEFKWLEKLHINDTNNSTWKFSLAQNYRRQAELEAKRDALPKAVENLAIADRFLTNLLAAADYKDWIEEHKKISGLRENYLARKDAPVVQQSR